MSIAEDRGFFWETIWNDPENAQLKALRRDPNVLFPGDIVTIPDKTVRSEKAATEQRARFVKKNPRLQIRLRLLDMQREPRAEATYKATVDGALIEGESDSSGYVLLRVPPNAKELKLEITEGPKTSEYVLPLGSIDPIEEVSGVQQRLTNLGYSCGSEQGTFGDLTRSAIRAFQKDTEMNITGDIDDATRGKLKEIHGS